MARYRFREGKAYAARLLGVRERPIENSPSSGLRLLRLEFEVFELDEPKRVLLSFGKIASRDIVCGPPIDATRDSSVAAYALALGIRAPNNSASWKQASGREIWVKVTFGPTDPSSLRNSFEQILPMNVQGWRVQAYDYRLDKEWVTPAEAADDLGCSESTIRRRIRDFEDIHGAQLVTRTNGNHRRIHLALLRNLWNSDQA